MPPFPAPEWVKDAVFYQIFPDRFANGDFTNDPSGVVPWGSAPTRDNYCGGDLQGLLNRLPYLEELGVNALYLTPIFRARSNHKYDTCDYLAVDPAFGDLELLRRLVRACHERGMRVVLDAVFNHCGDGFWAFEDMLQHGAASEYANWFFPTSFPVEVDPPNYQTCGGAASLPKLNTAHPPVRDYLLRVSRFWLEEAGIDGWRLDVPWKAPLDFWRDVRAEVKRANPEAYIVGELWRDPAPWLTGATCDGTINYPLRDAILDYAVHDHMDAEDFDQVSGRLRELHGPSAPYQLNLLGSHDTPRLLTVCGGDERRATVALVALFTALGAPMIYYGDELGLLGENDPGCRGCMPWDEKDWNQGLLQTYKRLIHARRTHPALRNGSLRPLLILNGVYAFIRCAGPHEVIVVLNPRQARSSVRIPLLPGVAAAPRWRDVLSGQIIARAPDGLWLEHLPARSAFLLVPAKLD